MILADIIRVFRIGGQVKNPANWKNTSAMTDSILSILVVLAAGLHFFGVDLPTDDVALTSIAAGIAFLLTAVSAITHVITSKKVGVPGLAPAEEPKQAGGYDPAKFDGSYGGLAPKIIYGTPEYIRMVEERVKRTSTAGHDY